ASCITHETAEFAVESIRRWWHLLGRKAYPQARRLLICADAGGQQRHAAPRLKSPSAGPGRSAGDGGDAVPLPARYEQMEQGRASRVFVHQYELARPAASQLRGRRQSDWRHDHEEWPLGESLT